MTRNAAPGPGFTANPAAYRLPGEFLGRQPPRHAEFLSEPPARFPERLEPHQAVAVPGRSRPALLTSRYRSDRQVRSLRGAFGLDEFLCACPGQNVVGRSSAWARCPSAFFHEIALLPSRRDFFQGREIRAGVAVLLEFLHADRREDCHDGSVGPLIRALVGGAGGQPATPGESE